MHYCNANGEEVFLSSVIHLQNINDVMWAALMEDEKVLMLQTCRIEGIYHKDTKTRKTGVQAGGRGTAKAAHLPLAPADDITTLTRPLGGGGNVEKRKMEDWNLCRYLGDENECLLPRGVGCECQGKDINPDGSINIFTCNRTEEPGVDYEH